MARTRKVSKPRRAATPDIRVSIPTEINEPPANLKDYCICLYGEKGVGKTSLASQFDNSLVLMLEPKRRNLKIRQVNIEPMSLKDMNRSNPDLTPWQYFQEYVKAVLEDGTVDTVVVDTVDRAYDSCLNHHCFQKGLNHPSDANDFGATWHRIKDDFESTMNKLLYADMGLVFISHAHLRVQEAKDGMEQWVPTCSPAAWKYIKAVADFALYYGYSGTDRAITLRGNENLWSACGVSDKFLTKSGELLEQFSTGDSHESAYKNLLAAFDNKLANDEVLSPREKRKK